MSEMVERVARAIAETYRDVICDGCGYTWEEATEEDRAGTNILARAAIQAMREPTETMVAAGMTEAETDLASEYRAMIDEALK